MRRKAYNPLVGTAMRIEVANSFGKRLVGLIGKSEIEHDYALLFPHCRSVHSNFMSATIDVVYLDEEYRVLQVETLHPWKMGHAPKDARHVAEMAQGEAEALHLEPGMEFCEEAR